MTVSSFVESFQVFVIILLVLALTSKYPKKNEVKKYMNPGDPTKKSNSLWLLLVGIIFLILNIVSFTVHYNLTTAYWYSNINEQYFNRPYLVITNSNSVAEQFWNINTLNDIKNYVQVFFSTTFLAEDVSKSPNYLNNRKILYGPYRFHTVNAKITSCPRGIDISQFNGTQNGIKYAVECLVDEKKLDDSIVKTDLGTNPNGKYKSADEAKLDYKITGDYHTYDGDGYTWDVYPNKINQKQFLTEFDSLLKEGFLGEQTLCLIISFIIYSKDLDLWSYNIIFVEKNLQGVIYPHHPMSMIFQPHKFQTPGEIFFLVFDIIKVTCLFSIAVYGIVKGFWRWKINKKIPLMKFTLLTLLYLLLISLTI